ncbi:tetratricopeptide repeat protein [bacterium]|nr:tetratricopeptide repeat protein [bacterium]
MGIYCETYKCQCTSKACGASECAKALETRRRAEELRGVILDKDGVVIVVRKPEAGYSEPQTFKPNIVLPPSPTEKKPRDTTFYLLIASSVFTLVLLVSALGYLGWIMLAPQPAPVGVPTQPVAVAAPPQAVPTPTPAQAPAELPPELRVTSVLQSSPSSNRPIRASGLALDSPERDNSPSGKLKSLGNEVRRKGNLKEAREFYRASVEADPSYYEGYNNLGNTYTDTGDHGGAAPIYQKGLVIVPESETLRFNLGNTMMRAGRYAEAAAEFERVVYYNESDMEARLLLGICYYHQGRNNEASAVFQSILAVDKDHALANYNLALVMDRLGRPELGSAYRREALRLKPELAKR